MEMEIPYTVHTRPDTGLTNPKLGVWLFLASEVMLFGSLFSISWGDVGLIALLGGVVVIAVVLLYRPLLAVALDEETARAAGLPVDALNLVLVALTALLVGCRKPEIRAYIAPKDDALDAAAYSIEREFGPIDVWINNAMATRYAPLREIEPGEFRRATEVTYLGAVWGTTAALRRMLPRDRGTIVQVGSALAYRGIPLQAAYCAAKHAVQGFCESLRAELLHDGSDVRVTQVHLPALNTPQFEWVKSRLPGRPQPVPPIFQPEVAAEAIFFAAHNPRREFWVGLPTVRAIVADKIVPGMVDEYLAEHGYESQQTDELADPHRPHNLWQPLDDDDGGDFGAEAGPRGCGAAERPVCRWDALAGLDDGNAGACAPFASRSAA